MSDLRTTTASRPLVGEQAGAREAERLAAAVFGVAGVAKRLSGEKDANYRITSPDGRRVLLKVFAADTDATVVAMQTAALCHVAERDPGMPVQRVVPARDGSRTPSARSADGRVHPLRMVTFLDGVALDATPASAEQRRSVGGAMARLQRALADFSHPADDHALVWDMKGAPALRQHLHLLREHDRGRAARALDRFERDIAPMQRQLPWQVVHNDFNGDNVLVDAIDPTRVAGIIDFDDMVRTPRLFDVAVTTAYQMRGASDPIGAVLDCLAGYAQGVRLSDIELELLPAAILTRMAMRLIVPEWRASLLPENRAYLTRNCDLVRHQFERLEAVPMAEFRERIRSALSAQARTAP